MFPAIGSLTTGAIAQLLEMDGHLPYSRKDLLAEYVKRIKEEAVKEYLYEQFMSERLQIAHANYTTCRTITSITS